MDEQNDENRSYVLIEFEDIGSVKFDAKLHNVIPLQLLALSQYLEFEGKNNLAMQRAAQMQYEMQKQQAQKIAVPGKPSLVVGNK